MHAPPPADAEVMPAPPPTVRRRASGRRPCRSSPAAPPLGPHGGRSRGGDRSLSATAEVSATSPTPPPTERTANGRAMLVTRSPRIDSTWLPNSSRYCGSSRSTAGHPQASGQHGRQHRGSGRAGSRGYPGPGPARQPRALLAAQQRLGALDVEVDAEGVVRRLVVAVGQGIGRGPDVGIEVRGQALDVGPLLGEQGVALVARGLVLGARAAG